MSYYNYGHHDYQQPPPQQNGAPSNLAEAEISVARNQMMESMQRVAASLRVAAEHADAFVRTVARSNPQVAATLLAQMSSGQSTTQQDLFGLSAFPPMGYGHGQAVMQPPQPPQQQPQQHQSLTPRASTSTPTPGHQGGYAPSANKKAAGDKPEKKAKKIRDPNMPKRPPSAYLLYQNEVRDDLREKHKDLSYPQILQKISEQWKMLPAPQRKVYQDATAREMTQWSLLKKQYDEGKGIVAAEGAGDDDSEEEEASDASGVIAQNAWGGARDDVDPTRYDNRLPEKREGKELKDKKSRSAAKKLKEWKV